MAEETTGEAIEQEDNLDDMDLLGAFGGDLSDEDPETPDEPVEADEPKADETPAEEPESEESEEEETTEEPAESEEEPGEEQQAGTPDKSGVAAKIEQQGYKLQNLESKFDNLSGQLGQLLEKIDTQGSATAEDVQEAKSIEDQIKDLGIDADDALTATDATKITQLQIQEAIKDAVQPLLGEINELKSSTQQQSVAMSESQWISNYESQGDRHKGQGQKVLEAARQKFNDEYGDEEMGDRAYSRIMGGIISEVEQELLPQQETPKEEPKSEEPKPSSKGTKIKKPGAQTKTDAEDGLPKELDPAKVPLFDFD